jgi:hypothetical protein
MPDYTSPQFDASQFSDPQNKALSVLSAICGPEVALAFSRYYGKNISPDFVLKTARDYGLWSVNSGMHGPQAQQMLLKNLGIPTEYSPEVNFAAIQEKLASGGVAALSSPNHYFFIQGYNPATGQYDTGESGRVYQSGGRYLTEQQMRQIGGGVNGMFTSSGNGTQQAASVPFTMPEWAAKSPYANLIVQSAQENGLDPNIFLRQINQESGLNPFAQSPAGARGIAQLMPSWWQGKFNPDDPNAAIPFAAQLMARYVQKYGGDYSKALAAYNAGEGAVDKYGGVPPYSETQNYIKLIMEGQPTPVAFSSANGSSPAIGTNSNQQASPPPQNLAEYWRQHSEFPQFLNRSQVNSAAPSPFSAMFTTPYSPPQVNMGPQTYFPNPAGGTIMRTEFGQGSMQPPIVPSNGVNRLIS